MTHKSMAISRVRCNPSGMRTLDKNGKGLVNGSVFMDWNYIHVQLNWGRHELVRNPSYLAT